MQFLKQSTATSVLIGPFLDDTDGKTAETGLDVTSMDCDLYKGVTKSDLTLTAASGDNDSIHVANGNYSLELTTGNTDTAGPIRITVNISGALPVWQDFMILTADAYDALFHASSGSLRAVDGSGNAIAPAATALLNTTWTDVKAAFLDASVNTVDGVADAIKTVTDKLDTAMELDGAEYRFTENALEEAPLNATGIGSISYTITLQDSEGTPIGAVDVWVSSDEAGETVVAGTSQTDNTTGQATFLLDEGTYYLWCQKGGWNFTNPTTLTVSE